MAPERRLNLIRGTNGPETRILKEGERKKKAAIPIKYKAKKKKKSLGNRITGPGPVVNVFPRPIAIFLGQGANWLNRTRLPPKTDSGKTNSVTRRRFPLPDINRSFATNNIFQLIRSLVFFFFFFSIKRLQQYAIPFLGEIYTEYFSGIKRREE